MWITMAEVYLLWFVLWCNDFWLYRRQQEFPSQLSYSACRTHARLVMLRVPLFVSKAGHFHLISLSVTIIAQNQTSKRSSVCFYWKSLSNRWVLSNNLMNTMCSQCFAIKIMWLIFIWLPGLVPWIVHAKRLEPGTSRRGVSHEFRTLWFRGTNGARSKFWSQQLDFFGKTGHLTLRVGSQGLVAGTSPLVCRPHELTSHVDLDCGFHLANGCFGRCTENCWLWGRCAAATKHFETWRGGEEGVGFTGQEDICSQKNSRDFSISVCCLWQDFNAVAIRLNSSFKLFFFLSSKIRPLLEGIWHKNLTFKSLSVVNIVTRNGHMCSGRKGRG